MITTISSYTLNSNAPPLIYISTPSFYEPLDILFQKRMYFLPSFEDEGRNYSNFIVAQTSPNLIIFYILGKHHWGM